MSGLALPFPVPGSGEPANASRRGFLLAAGAGALILGSRSLGGALSSSGHATSGGVTSAGRVTPRLAAATFLPLVGTTFTVEGPGGVRSIRLAEVADRTTTRHPREARLTAGERFSLLFTGQPGEPLPSGAHTLHHARLGTVELFLAPVGRGLKDQDYEAIIDRRRPVRR